MGYYSGHLDHLPRRLALCPLLARHGLLPLRVLRTGGGFIFLQKGGCEKTVLIIWMERSIRSRLEDAFGAAYS